MYRNSVDIANRALDHCGITQMDETDGFTEDSEKAQLLGRLYNKLRRAELRRRTWKFAIKDAVLRSLNLDPTVMPPMLMSPVLWGSGTTYFYGSVVSDAQGALWISSAPDNVGNSPGNSTYWDAYFGPLAITPYDTTGETAYVAGDVIYTAAGDGTYHVYLSLVSDNDAVPGTADAYSATGIYMKDDLVTSASVTYQSLLDLNIGNTPVSSPTQWTVTTTRTVSSNNWLELGAALTQLKFPFPLGAGPTVVSSARTAFRLPANFLRMASSQDPKAGSTSWLGAASGNTYLDWTISGDYLLSGAEQAMIVLRFVADVTNVLEMDDMFCEGLAARMGYEACPKLTQSSAKQKDIAAAYNEFMGQARIIDSIDQGAIEPAEDDYVAARQ